MQRPQKPTPQQIRFKLKENFKTGMYEITENNITYSMTLELTRHLKENIVQANSVAEWYKNLDKFTRSKIIRTGTIPTEKDNDFFPDFVPED